MSTLVVSSLDCLSRHAWVRSSSQPCKSSSNGCRTPSTLASTPRSSPSSSASPSPRSIVGCHPGLRQALSTSKFRDDADSNPLDVYSYIVYGQVGECKVQNTFLHFGSPSFFDDKFRDDADSNP